MTCLGCGEPSAPDLNAMCRLCFNRWAWKSGEFARLAKVTLQKADAKSKELQIV